MTALIKLHKFGGKAGVINNHLPNKRLLLTLLNISLEMRSTLAIMERYIDITIGNSSPTYTALKQDIYTVIFVLLGIGYLPPGKFCFQLTKI